MIEIVKQYHFYAAHRNQLINDKCRNLHGHTYYLTLTIKPRSADESGVTFLFSDIDKIVDPIIKELDHSTILHKADPLWEYLTDWNYDRKFDQLKIVGTDEPTSAENLAMNLYEAISPLLPKFVYITEIILQETTTSKIKIKFTK